MRKSSRTLIVSLGCLGLMPFIASTLVYHTDLFHLGFQSQPVFIAYSAVILSFLSGSIWGQVLEQPYQVEGKTLLVFSNAIAVGAWLALLIHLNALSIILLLFGYISLFWMESRWLKQIRIDQTFYPKMRFVLTAIVCTTHLFMLYPKY